MATDSEIRAEQARQVLDNPVFKQAFFPLQVQVIDEIETTDIGDTTTLVNLAIKLKAIREFENQLVDAIQTAQIEERPQEYEAPAGLM